jgi:hypothetical protein
MLSGPAGVLAGEPATAACSESNGGVEGEVESLLGVSLARGGQGAELADNHRCFR